MRLSLNPVVSPRRLRAVGVVAVIAFCLIALIVSVEAFARRASVKPAAVPERLGTDGLATAPDPGETFTLPSRENVEAP